MANAGAMVGKNFAVTDQVIYSSRNDLVAQVQKLEPNVGKIETIELSHLRGKVVFY